MIVDGRELAGHLHTCFVINLHAHFAVDCGGCCVSDGSEQKVEKVWIVVKYVAAEECEKCWR